MPSWTTTEALTVVRRRGVIPAADPVNTDAALMDEMDSIISERMAPAISSIRESYWVKEKSYTVTADQAEYRLPERATGDFIVDVVYQDASGSHKSLARYWQEERHPLNNDSTNLPEGFVVQGNQLVIIPTPNATVGTLKVSYQNRRGKLIATSSAMQITGISGVTISGNPPTAWTINDTFDFVQDKPGFDTLGTDLTISGINPGTSVAMDATPPTDLAVGDWLSLAWETPVIQLPMELHSALYWGVASSFRAQIGDESAAQSFERRMNTAIAHVVSSMTPRVKGESMKVHNPRSFLRGGRAWHR